MKYRIEKDSMGELQVPHNALYAAQTQRAIDNFPISGLVMPNEFITTLAIIKKAIALVNQELKLLDADIAGAIVNAADDIINGKYIEHFPIDIFQTGSGTSTNMNMNEVLATLASKSIGKNINPNDHINMGQSSNDVIPTAIHVSAALQINNKLLPALSYLQNKLLQKQEQVKGICKTGRTHLMDAMPIQISQEIHGWATQISKNKERLIDSNKRLCCLAQGGTAVGTGINVPSEFAKKFAKKISELSGIQFITNSSFFESLSCQDTSVEISGQLKTLAVSFMKIANDLRWMNSGPLAGFSEIELPALQPGSSIMPGKVNPVIPEAVAMVAAQVIGNDTTITIAGQSGNFQLNVMLPVIVYNLLQSIKILSTASITLADKAIDGFTVQKENMQSKLARNPILVTALNPLVGYLKAAEIAKKAYKEKRDVIDVAKEMTDIPEKELRKILDPVALTKGGMHQ